MTPDSQFVGAFVESIGWTMLLVAARFAPFVVVLPFFGGLAASPTVRGAAALAIGVALWPGTLIAPGAAGVEAVRLVASQLAVGTLSAIGVLVVVEAARTIGSILDTALGRGSFGAADPLGAGASGPMATLYALGFVAVFMGSGAHVLFIEGLAASADRFPLDATLDLATGRAMALTVVALLSAAFAAAVALALPALGVGLIVDASLGWMGRAMPQLPVLFVAMPLRMVLGWTVIAATLAGALAWVVGAVGESLLAMLEVLP